MVLYAKETEVSSFDDPTETGDHWDVNCIDPESKLLLTLIPGKRTSESIHLAVADAAARLAAGYKKPAIFTDGEDAYRTAILDVFGTRYTSARAGAVGRPRLPIIRVPQDKSSARLDLYSGYQAQRRWQS